VRGPRRIPAAPRGERSLGAVLLFRAFIGLTLWERPRGRRTIVWAVLFIVGIGAPGFSGGEGGSWWALLAIPWLWSFRWRSSLSAGWLAIASVSALVHIPLQTVAISWTPLQETLLMPKLMRFSLICGAMTAFYAFLAAPAAGARIHLSIRRIGRRLIVSHLLAGIVPFVFAILFVLLAGALFLSTYRGSIGSQYLVNVSGEARRHIIEELHLPPGGMRMPFWDAAARQTLIARSGDGPVEIHGAPVPFAPDSLLLADAASRDVPLLWDEETLFVRARLDTTRDGSRLAIEALAPVDSLRIDWISRVAGVAIRVNPAVEVGHAGGGVQLGGVGSDGFSRSIGPASRNGRGSPEARSFPACFERMGSGKSISSW